MSKNKPRRRMRRRRRRWMRLLLLVLVLVVVADNTVFPWCWRGRNFRSAANTRVGDRQTHRRAVDGVVLRGEAMPRSSLEVILQLGRVLILIHVFRVAGWYGGMGLDVCGMGDKLWEMDTLGDV